MFKYVQQLATRMAPLVQIIKVIIPKQQVQTKSESVQYIDARKRVLALITQQTVVQMESESISYVGARMTVLELIVHAIIIKPPAQTDCESALALITN